MSETKLETLRLLAQDVEDLQVLSSAMQDALVRMRDLSFDPRARRFILTANRFCWERARERGPYLRVRSALSVDGVRAVRSRNLRIEDAEALAYLLAVRFEPAQEAPEGVMLLLFAGGGEIRLDCECIDAVLADIGAPWPTRRKPNHSEA